jgi:hypothetical protein
LKQNVYNVSSQKEYENDVESEESSGIKNKISLPLCFSSFECLKANHGIPEETGSSDYIHSSTFLHENIVIIEEHQLHSHALNDHYLERYFNSELQPVLDHRIKEEVDQRIVIKDHFPSPETNVDVQNIPVKTKYFKVAFLPLKMM